MPLFFKQLAIRSAFPFLFAKQHKNISPEIDEKCIQSFTMESFGKSTTTLHRFGTFWRLARVKARGMVGSRRGRHHPQTSPFDCRPVFARNSAHPWRWIVERTFGWLNRSQRLSKDFEALATYRCTGLKGPGSIYLSNNIQIIQKTIRACPFNALMRRFAGRGQPARVDGGLAGFTPSPQNDLSSVLTDRAF